MKRKILTVTPGLRTGGAEVAILRLCEATPSFDHFVLSLSPKGELAPRFANIAPVIEGFSLRTLREIRKLCPDLIVAHMYKACLAALPLRVVAPVHWVIHHSIADLSLERRSTRAAVQACRVLSPLPQKIIYVSERSAGQHQKLGFPPGEVIPNVHDLTRFKFDPAARLRIRQELGIPLSSKVLGHVARVHPMKDHATLLAALALLPQDVHLILCGAGTQVLNAPANVHRLGLREDIAAIMSACDIGVLSSSHGEALPNVLIEFQACERPCVTTDVGDSASLVGDTACVVQPRDSAALANALMRLLQADDLVERGRRARATMLARFNDAAARYAGAWVGQHGQEQR